MKIGEIDVAAHRAEVLRLHAEGSYVAALAQVESALEVLPGWGEMWRMRGQLLQLVDGPALSLPCGLGDVRASLERAVSLQPSDLAAWRELLAFLDAVMEDREGVEICAQAIATLMNDEV